MNKFAEYVIPLLDTEDNHDIDAESAAGIGWRSCKKAILEILKTPIHNLDLSTEEVDQRFIELIEKEI